MKTRYRLFLMAVDLISVLTSLLIALDLRFQGNIPSKFLQGNLIPYVTLCAFSAGMLWLFGLYNKVWRYASIEEGINLFYAITASFFIFGIPAFVSHGTFCPRQVVIIGWLVALFLLGGVRLLLRLATSKIFFHPGSRKVLIVGGGDAAEAVVRELKRNHSIYWPVGILDDKEKNRDIKIHGVPILGQRSDLPSLLRGLGIRDVVITYPSPSNLKEIFEFCQGLNVEFKTIPGVQELMDGKMKFTPVRDIRIEDLLGRQPVQINLNSIQSYIAGKSVLVTGAGGSIGSELCRQIVSFQPSQLTLLGHGENSIYEIFLELSKNSHCLLKPVVADIRHRERMQHIFENVKPNVIFHAAAHKHVPFMQVQAFEAFENNFLATGLLADLSMQAGVKKFIFLSTDKSVQPESVMGVTKRLTEMYLQALNQDLEQKQGQHSTQFLSVRFGNVLDSRGSVVPTFRKQILMGGPVTVTHAQMTRYFMTIPEAVELVLQAAALGKGGELFLLDMGRPINILDLARQMIRLAGYEPDKDIPIQFVGPRPGEKLTEKLYDDDEQVEPTSFAKILRVQWRLRSFEEFITTTRSFEEFMTMREEMKTVCRQEDEHRLKELLSRFVPEYAGKAVPS